MSDLIPEEHKVALDEFTSLANSNNTLAEQLLNALELASPALLVGDVAKTVSTAVGVPIKAVRPVLFMLASMSRARASSGLSIDRFADVVGDTLAQGDSTAKENWPAVKKYLTRALSAPAIQVTAKALQIAGEHNNLFCHARIISDLRPVFDDDTEDARALLISHQLKLAYHQSHGDEDAGEVFVSMDHADLLRLRDVVDRALRKHEKLQELAQKTGLPVLARKP
jgi:hypothetical protein